jgi:hypothetical protein
MRNEEWPECGDFVIYSYLRFEGFERLNIIHECFSLPRSYVPKCHSNSDDGVLVNAGIIGFAHLPCTTSRV